MKIKLTDKLIISPEYIRNLPEALEVYFEGNLKKLIKDIDFCDFNKINLILKGEKNTIVCEGRIEAAFKAECERCLDEFIFEVRKDIHLNLSSPLKIECSKPIHLKEDDLDTVFLTEDKIDLVEIIRSEILLELPIKVLCKDDCKGLCKVCGANLNKTTCQHATKPTT